MVPEIIMRIVQGRGTNGSVLHGMDWPAADRKAGRRRDRRPGRSTGPGVEAATYSPRRSVALAMPLDVVRIDGAGDHHGSHADHVDARVAVIEQRELDRWHTSGTSRCRCTLRYPDAKISRIITATEARGAEGTQT